MALTEQQKRDTWKWAMDQDSAVGGAGGFTKPNLQAAVTALDNAMTLAWINSILPDPAKTNMTAQQKALLVAAVALMKAGKV